METIPYTILLVIHGGIAIRSNTLDLGIGGVCPEVSDLEIPVEGRLGEKNCVGY